MSAFDRVFDRDVLGRLRAAGAFERCEVLTASGPYPSDDLSARRVRWLRARRASWEAYLDAADACGLLEDVEFVGKLRSSTEADFRSAMSECLTAFVLGRIGFALVPKPAGRGGKILDFAAKRGQHAVHVEVKAPMGREVPENGVFSGDDRAAIVSAVENASRQFERGTANLLVLVPRFAIGVAEDRDQLVAALIGEQTIEFEVDRRTGRGGPARAAFKANGRLMPRAGRGGALTKPDHTRVSAVMCVEERLVETSRCDGPGAEEIAAGAALGDRRPLERALAAWARGWLRPEGMWFEHVLTVVHNPFAVQPVPEALFDEYAQLVCRGSEMVWTNPASAVR